MLISRYGNHFEYTQNMLYYKIFEIEIFYTHAQQQKEYGKKKYFYGQRLIENRSEFNFVFS